MPFWDRVLENPPTKVTMSCNLQSRPDPRSVNMDQWTILPFASRQKERCHLARARRVEWGLASPLSRRPRNSLMAVIHRRDKLEFHMREVRFSASSGVETMRCSSIEMQKPSEVIGSKRIQLWLYVPQKRLSNQSNEIGGYHPNQRLESKKDKQRETNWEATMTATLTCERPLLSYVLSAKRNQAWSLYSKSC